MAMKYLPKRTCSDSEFLDLVSRALRDVVVPELPLLSCQIKGVHTPMSPYYEYRPISQVPVVLVRECRDITEFLRREHDIPPNEEALWRVSLVPEADSFWVSFAYHHAIGDGSSGLIFHEHLLCALQGMEDGTVPSTEYRPLPPPIEECGLNLKASWYDLCKEILGVLPLPSIIRDYINGPKYYGGNETTYEQRRNTRTGLKVLRLHARHVERLRTLAKVHNVNIHALLHGSAIHCIDTDEHIKTSTPISLRPLLPDEHKKNMGNYICCHVSMTPIASDVVSTAKMFHAELHQPSLRDQAMRQLGLLEYIDSSPPTDGSPGGMEKVLLQRLNTTNNHCLGATLEVSNLGNWKAPLFGAWRVEDVHFAGSNSSIGELFNLGVVTLAGGDMKVACTYRQGYIDEPEVSGFMERLRATLESL
ncbi:Uncharacterized protein C18B11.03c [Taphrina deformans PYCC 5710]|uniref:Uncharacterized protein C18B11.03c n=1 Tax=Taphrina deformans (strain PYCC 5710 / ATCC 11124 / CBS 356.35 / IMI 108563 / JCM 9778 / NBRC 8474) TaxID=1097556 RepID=R4XBW9_TAPDE|nr:Uncharacterized protein C18B11.03c [Taphrina deformans PYCC 5710]|eukprot:CCG83299.1 Uncharacterized protein C18B11.03c [Taphrina deformans PYCC 5710]